MTRSLEIMTMKLMMMMTMMILLIILMESFNFGIKIKNYIYLHYFFAFISFFLHFFFFFCSISIVDFVFVFTAMNKNSKFNNIYTNKSSNQVPDAQHKPQSPENCSHICKYEIINSSLNKKLKTFKGKNNCDYRTKQ